MNEPKWEEFVGVLQEEIDNLEAASSGKLKPSAGTTEIIRNFYESCKRQMKVRMSRGGRSWEFQRLDRHKVAAAICRSVVQAIPFGDIDQGDLNIRAANEILAFIVATRVLMSFAAKEARDAKDVDLANHFERGPSLPETSDGEPFALHFYRSLYWHRQGNKQSSPTIDNWLDPFQMSIAFFMIELMSSLPPSDTLKAQAA